LLVATLLATRAGRALGVHPLVAATLIAGCGAVLAATLTPSWDAILWGARGDGGCDMSRLWFAPWSDLQSFNDISLNILLFVPLGFAVGMLPRRRLSTALLVGAVALPFGVEGTQMVVRQLDRACQGSDVFDNLSGLVVGVLIAVAARKVAQLRAARRRP
jgi:hypothetical protein